MSNESSSPREDIGKMEEALTRLEAQQSSINDELAKLAKLFEDFKRRTGDIAEKSQSAKPPPK